MKQFKKITLVTLIAFTAFPVTAGNEIFKRSSTYVIAGILFFLGKRIYEVYFKDHSPKPGQKLNFCGDLAVELLKTPQNFLDKTDLNTVKKIFEKDKGFLIVRYSAYLDNKNSDQEAFDIIAKTLKNQNQDSDLYQERIGEYLGYFKTELKNQKYSVA